MVNQTHSVEDLLAHVRSDFDPLGELLERYRPYLDLVAGQRIDPRIVGRVCQGDLVQETLTELRRDSTTFVVAPKPSFPRGFKRF